MWFRVPLGLEIVHNWHSFFKIRQKRCENLESENGPGAAEARNKDLVCFWHSTTGKEVVFMTAEVDGDSTQKT